MFLNNSPSPTISTEVTTHDEHSEDDSPSPVQDSPSPAFTITNLHPELFVDESSQDSGVNMDGECKFPSQSSQQSASQNFGRTRRSLSADLFSHLSPAQFTALSTSPFVSPTLSFGNPLALSFSSPEETHEEDDGFEDSASASGAPKVSSALSQLLSGPMASPAVGSYNIEDFTSPTPKAMSSSSQSSLSLTPAGASSGQGESRVVKRRGLFRSPSVPCSQQASAEQRKAKRTEREEDESKGPTLKRRKSIIAVSDNDQENRTKKTTIRKPMPRPVLHVSTLKTSFQPFCFFISCFNTNWFWNYCFVYTEVPVRAAV